MFNFAKTRDDINCNLTSLIYFFETGYKAENDKIVVKIGKTSKTIRERIFSYTNKGITNIHWIQIENINNFESKLKKYLKYHLGIELFKGTEYFLTNLETVKQAIITLINNDSIDQNDTKLNTEKIESTNEDNSGENYICTFCGKVYSTKSNLALHQKTAKFCLNIQRELESNDSQKGKKTKVEKKESSSNQYTCKYCNSIFSLKFSLTRHLDVCKVKKNKDEEKLKNEQMLSDMRKELDYLKADNIQLKLELDKQKKEKINYMQVKLELDKQKTEKAILFNNLKNKEELCEQLKIERDNLLKQLFELISTPIVNNNKTTNN